jgi:endonuclease/exonuclease/phosphatase family metal-dependent hydrolase
MPISRSPGRCIAHAARTAVALCLAPLALACATRGAGPAAPRVLRVLVYNIHAGKDARDSVNLPRVAAVVRSTGADVALFQEVDRNTTRSGRVDQIAELARLTGFHGALGKSLSYQGGDYGIAVFSRWPLRSDSTIALSIPAMPARSGGSTEPRVAQHAVIAAPGGHLDVLNTHLDASGTDQVRLQEAAVLTAATTALRARGTGVLLVGGDFNATPDSEVHARVRAAGLTDAWLTCGEGNALTYPAGAPIKRIDYLFIAGPVRCTSARVIDSDASDHRGVLFTLVIG